MPKKKVLLGMSGGVDSSVSAVLLLEEGYEVIGAFMKNWSDGDDSVECSWRAERRDAMRVAAQLGIAFHTFDYEAEYREHVYAYMIREYKAGRTPNPDVLCNKYMKFGFLLQEAENLGCDYIATGHYARIVRDENGTHLLAGVDNNKDQSYFLARLEQNQLEKMLLPIGHLEKAQVRDIAREHNLIVAEKKDSQGICFVGKVKLVDFLKERIDEHEGNIVTTNGEVIGKHRGYEFYTNGQRSGLGIGGGTPYFVIDRKPETNEVIVAIGDDDPALFKSTLIATDFTETISGVLETHAGKKLLARIRYRQPLQECVFTKTDAGLEVVFTEPQRAIAPGQFIAFYDGEELLGSAVIDG
ncbi:MAG: tRNA 2-thiouridine(34) synthase MnmA [bacterium]|nr:tRNA 2-thiouridine(34) synthase MnmA [bacterium]